MNRKEKLKELLVGVCEDCGGIFDPNNCLIREGKVFCQKCFTARGY